MSISVSRKRERRAVRLRGSLAFLGLALLVAILSSCVSDRGAGELAAATVEPLVGVSQGTLITDDAVAGDNFGWSVAVAKDTAVVGVLNSEGESGVAAHVFVRSGALWSRQAKLLADDGVTSGYSVAVAGDTAVTGAPSSNGKSDNTGGAYVFVRSGATWSQQAKLVADDGASEDALGASVAVAGDTAVAGAPGGDNKDMPSGAAYVFVRNGATWSQQAKLVADDGVADDQFGYSVAVAGDTAIVGALYHTEKDEGTGAAYVFVRSGATWSQQAKLLADDAAAGDQFGDSVAVTGDTAVVGALGHVDKRGQSGAAYVFVRSGATWSQQAKLVADDAAADDNFGASVAVTGDTAVVGAPNRDEKGTDSGATYVFVRSGDTWSQQAKLVADDGVAGDKLGSSVALSGDTAVAGAPFRDDKGTDSGAANAFVLRSGSGDDESYYSCASAEGHADGRPALLVAAAALALAARSRRRRRPRG